MCTKRQSSQLLNDNVKIVTAILMPLPLKYSDINYELINVFSLNAKSVGLLLISVKRLLKAHSHI